jgi:hypothetical protein
MNKRRFHGHNAWVYEYPDRYILRSYDTQVATIVKGNNLNVILTNYWDYSTSTKRQLTRFLQEYLDLPYYINQSWITPNDIRKFIQDKVFKTRKVEFDGYYEGEQTQNQTKL